MHKPESLFENETYKILWDLQQIQTDYQIPARRPDLMSINKKNRTCYLVNIAVLMDHRVWTHILQSHWPAREITKKQK